MSKGWPHFFDVKGPKKRDNLQAVTELKFGQSFNFLA